MSRPASSGVPKVADPARRDAVEHRERLAFSGIGRLGVPEPLRPVDAPVLGARRAGHVDAPAPHRAAERRHDRDAGRVDAGNRQHALADAFVGRAAARPAPGRRGACRSRRAARDRDRTRAARASDRRTSAGTARRRRRARATARPAPRPARWRRSPRPAAALLRPRSFIASMGAPRAARSAGATPKTSAATIATAAVKREHAPIERQLEIHGIRRELRHQQLAAPLRHDQSRRRAHRASSRLSISSCRARRPRDAPSARRTLHSWLRAVARASSRLAMLAHAISSTSPTTTIITSSGRLILLRGGRTGRPPRGTSVNGSDRYWSDPLDPGAAAAASPRESPAAASAGPPSRRRSTGRASAAP